MYPSEVCGFRLFWQNCECRFPFIDGIPSIEQFVYGPTIDPVLVVEIAEINNSSMTTLKYKLVSSQASRLYVTYKPLVAPRASALSE
jgi:hypothetical protein